MLDLRLLWRDWRGGQLNLIISALVLAVMVVTAVSLLADRVERGLDEQISSFLAADLAVQSALEFDSQLNDQAEQIGLSTAEVVFFSSMVFAGDNNHLAAVKVVDDYYPLRGQIEVTTINDQNNVELLGHGPKSGEAWVEARLLSLIGIELGDTIDVGYASLRVTRIITNEPDRGTGFSMTGARVMMHQDDLERSQLIRPGSRLTRRLLLSGTEASIDQFSQWYSEFEETQPEVASHYRLRTPENSEQRLAEALQRGRAFLLLSGTIGVLLAGLAMALASQRYADRLTDQVALMKAWGESARSIRRSQMIRLLVITTLATLMGMALGWAAHFLLLETAKGIFAAELPLPGWRPWVVAVVTGFVSVLGFALPALWHLPTVAPLKVLRRDLPNSLVSRGRRLILGIGALLLLAYWYSNSLVIALMFMAALFTLFFVCAVIALQFLKLVQKYGSWQGSFIRLGLANLWRRKSQTMVQLLGFSVTLMLLLVTTGMRTNLIAEWQAQLPEDAPTHFVFNVATPELEGVKQVLADYDIQPKLWYPMVRGRLVSLNGEQLTAERLRKTDGLGREVNLTQSALLPADNEILAGSWWSDSDAKGDPQGNSAVEFSMEQEVATELGVSIGDEIEFSIGGLKLLAKLTSIRSVNWDNMQANFYIIFKPGSLDRFAPNWVTSLSTDKLTPTSSVFYQQAPFIATLIKQYPTAVVLELGEVVARIKNIIDRVTLGLEMILILVLACGGLVLFAAIGVSYDERLRENAVLRTLGSSRKIVTGSLLVEFSVLGLIAGVIAVFGAEAILYTVQTNLFNMQASLHPQLWVLGLLGGVAVISTLGLLRSREIISVPPLQSLRQVD